MLLKALFLAILIYFVLKTAMRLIAAMQAGTSSSQPNRERGWDGGERTRSWDGSTQRRAYDTEDVEDAKFVDV